MWVILRGRWYAGEVAASADLDNGASYLFSNVADFVNDWIYNGNTVILTGLAVTAQGTPSGQVNVATGIASQAGYPIHISTQQVANILSGSPGTNTWGTGEAAGSLPRIDIVVAQYATQDGTPLPRNVDNNGTITQESLNTTQSTYYALNVVHGTPAGSPVAPSVPSGWFLLATIAVAANASTVVAADITDNTVTLKNSGGWLNNVSGGILWRNDSAAADAPELDTASGILLKLGTSGAQVLDNTALHTLDLTGGSGGIRALSAVALTQGGSIPSGATLTNGGTISGGSLTGVSVGGSSTWTGGSIAGSVGGTPSLTQEWTFGAGITGTGSIGSLTAPWGNLTSVPSLVNTWNGRSGAVTPAANDYAFSQISGTAGNSQLAGPLVSSVTAGTNVTTSNPAGVGAATVNVPSFPWADLTGVPSLVNTFNGRSGAVTPASGDYSFSLISGTLASSQLPFQIEFGSIAVGTNDTGSVTFPTAFSSTPTILVSEGGSTTAVTVYTHGESPTGFSWNATNNGFTLNWIAIGS